MINGFEPLRQEVISDNQKIFETILESINQAKTEILVAISWFTDDQLYTALLMKRMQGVNIDLILGDNEENEKLNFNALKEKGVNILRVKNVGYGIMHQKFCIIDRQLALHGSYNWSINAKNNNHESIIVTTHKQTVDSLTKTFFDIKERAVSMLNGEGNLPLPEPQDRPAKTNGVVHSILQKIEPIPAKDWDSTAEFTRILDSMIAAEVSNFDRNLLRKQGYERSKSNNGDAQVLGKAFDSVYSVFINEINVVEDKKKRLISKIEEQKNRSIQLIKETTDLKISTIGIEFENLENSLSTKTLNLKTDITKSESELEKIIEIKIPRIENRTVELTKEINRLQLDYIAPSWKLREIIPVSVLGIFLFLYLVLFYSSAAYILLFSETDAKAARMNGIMVSPPEVFDPDAISKVANKSGTAIFYVFLFVVIPLAFAIIRFAKNKLVSLGITFLVGIVLVDSFIAFKVAKSIHEVEYLTGKIDTVWQLDMIFQDPNFYMVFILGALGLVLFKFSFDKVIEILEERDPDTSARKNKLIIKQLNDDITQNEAQLFQLKDDKKDIGVKILAVRAEIEACEHEREMSPSKKATMVESKQTESGIKIQGIESVTVIYKSHIENDDLPVSINSMKDRINIFLEGWDDLLYEEFAVAKASEKCTQAFEAATNWLTEKLRNSIDKRVSV